MKKNVLLLLIIVLFLVAPNRQVAAKNLVKIATIGANTPHIDPSLSYQQKVDAIKEFLTWQLGQVLSDHPDLIVLPEICDQPRGMSNKEKFEYFEVRGTHILDFLSDIASKNRCYIAFGMYRQDNEGFWRNSSVMLDRNGKIAGIYDKNFATPDEMKIVTSSDEVKLIQTDFGSVACAICFDLNFDELQKRYAELKPDLIVFMGLFHGGMVQAEWAYSCRSWFVGSIGVGSVFSQIRNPFGQVVATSSNHFDYVVSTVNLDCELVHLDHNKVHLRELKKKYEDKVTIYNTGEFGVVMITSEDDNSSAKDMVKEFNFEKLDHYFNRTRSDREKLLKER